MRRVLSLICVLEQNSYSRTKRFYSILSKTCQNFFWTDFLLRLISSDETICRLLGLILLDGCFECSKIRVEEQSRELTSSVLFAKLRVILPDVRRTSCKKEALTHREVEPRDHKSRFFASGMSQAIALKRQRFLV